MRIAAERHDIARRQRPVHDVALRQIGKTPRAFAQRQRRQRRAADIAVRIIPSTSDIKVGVLTSIIGVPFFLYLIMRQRRSLAGGVT